MTSTRDQNDLVVLLIDENPLFVIGRVSFLGGSLSFRIPHPATCICIPCICWRPYGCAERYVALLCIIRFIPLGMRYACPVKDVFALGLRNCQFPTYSPCFLGNSPTVVPVVSCMTLAVSRLNITWYPASHYFHTP